MFHNHITYTKNKGVIKDIYKSNGKARSQRAGIIQYSK